MNLNRSKILFFLLLLGFCFSNAPAQDRRLLPVDEGRRDASFALFRRNLIRAVERRDARFVLGVVDRDIQNGFGGEDGIENFKKAWKLSDPKSAFWSELMLVLAGGGAFQKGATPKTFWSPYVYANFPENLDAFEHAAVIVPSVKLRADPSASAGAVADLSYALVKVDYNNSVKEKSNPERFAWFKVETFGGKKGFVPSRALRSPIDYRAAFEKKAGGWKMVFFAAGD